MYLISQGSAVIVVDLKFVNKKGKTMNKSQYEYILEALLDGDSITPIDALDKWGCFRLAAAIYNIKKNGYKVKTTIVKNKLTKKRYARYSLENREPIKKEYVGENTYSVISSLGYRGEK